MPHSSSDSGELPADADCCARALLETMPYVVRVIRSEMRAHGNGLSLAQFRTLVFLSRNPGADLGALAEHLGVTAATASASVNRLVQQGLVLRALHPQSRRRVELSLTAAGDDVVQAARQSTQAQIATRLQRLPETDQGVLLAATRILRDIFAPPEKGGVAQS